MTTLNASRGVVLIIVAGLSALLISLSIAFLVKIQSTESNTAQVQQETQARIMLHAACSFILESSRLGYDTDSSSITKFPYINTSSLPLICHRQTFGWADVRDGTIGPKDQAFSPAYKNNGQWPNIDPSPSGSPNPGGGVIICPMYRWTTPPYAIKRTMAYNPIVSDSTQPNFGAPLLINPDPEPANVGPWTISASGNGWTTFATGNPQPIQNSLGISWFRVHRVGITTFVVTCGSGGTYGFRNWNEVIHGINGNSIPGAPDSPSSLFGNSEAVFNQIRSNEFITWYEIQWSAAVKPVTCSPNNVPPPGFNTGNSEFYYLCRPVNSCDDLVQPYQGGWTVNSYTQRQGTNPVGTISYIRRLLTEPNGLPQPLYSSTNADAYCKWSW